MNRVQSLLPSFHHKDDLLEKALECNQIQLLFDQANKSLPEGSSGSWEVKKVKLSSVEGRCDWSKHQIQINKNLPLDKSISALVLQLIQVINTPRIQELDTQAKLKQISCEEYIKEFVRIDHQGFNLHHLLMKHAIEQMNWDSSLDKFARVQRNFSGFWNQERCSTQTEVYRARYHNLQLT